MKSKYFVPSILVLAFLFMSFTFDEPGKQDKKVTVEIDYHDAQPDKSLDIIWNQGLTALEALQKAAKVETYSVRENVIVISIDEDHSEKGQTAWYYEVNNEIADVLAIDKILSAGDTVTWIHQADTCSNKVNP